MEVTDRKNVGLHFFKPEHLDTLLQFHLPDEQKKFTGMPSDILKTTLEDSERYPVVITGGDKPVGFFVLHKGVGILPFTSNKDAILLRAFSIDLNAQGQGFGKKSMQLLPAFVRENFSFINEIVLAVNMKNKAAKALYEKVGFVDRGAKREGSIGLQHILHYDLA
ncbi:MULTISPECIES: GNAT family N-acetyltransferase [unclassified Bacillus (in: firmicutes)]|uniref:GNAT family N-acetyltransferase n=1 Tax=unclassified Bacillus (in: firmicutes) TaxID=185979 RepID=UPI0008DFC61B|nr:MULTISPECIES: GNAT family N-acetyltransferase [unclassified Bacillus (in: firmicutes)]SFA88045.1 Protein N-acetyltransferase, RimJ/RimL family [Bacillus sp. UNCCL13]SFQ84496.1 Protein N-acetyltransferase, RimJ/RimL family [Bacillus sp. cl95]